jgi:hypothetical protein
LGSFGKITLEKKSHTTVPLRLLFCDPLLIAWLVSPWLRYVIVIHSELQCIVGFSIVMIRHFDHWELHTSLDYIRSNILESSINEVNHFELHHSRNYLRSHIWFNSLL